MHQFSNHIRFFFRLINRCEVGVGQRLKSGDPVVGRFLKHPHQEVKSLRINFFVFLSFEGDVAGSVLGQHFIVSLAGEGADSKQQDVEDEAKTENVTNWIVFSLHVLDVDDLRCNVSGSTAAHKEVLFGFGEFSKTEVSNHTLPTALTPKDEVFWLEVAMHDPFGVHFLESLQNGVDNKLDFRALEFVFGLDLIVELATFQQLDHNVERVLRFKNLMKFHAVLVVEVSHDLDFLDQALLSLVLTVGCLLRKCLNCEVFSAFQLFGQVY